MAWADPAADACDMPCLPSPSPPTPPHSPQTHLAQNGVWPPQVDPEAARIVFESGVGLAMVPLEVRQALALCALCARHPARQTCGEGGRVCAPGARLSTSLDAPP